MLLGQTAKYALRAMSTLASLAPGESIRAHELSEITGVPVHYLSKIMRWLVVKKLVTSRKGRGGGFSLAVPARKITFAAILEAGNFIVESNDCAYGWGSCDLNNPCPLHETYSRLQEAVVDWMETTTLADVGRDERVRELLGREDPPE